MHVLQSNFCCRKFILNLGSATAPVPAAHGPTKLQQLLNPNKPETRLLCTQQHALTYLG